MCTIWSRSKMLPSIPNLLPLIILQGLSVARTAQGFKVRIYRSPILSLWASNLNYVHLIGKVSQQQQRKHKAVLFLKSRMLHVGLCVQYGVALKCHPAFPNHIRKAKPASNSSSSQPAALLPIILERLSLARTGTHEAFSFIKQVGFALP